MKTEDHRILEELKRRLGELTEILDLRLYGSRARGDADDDSDMDVFLVVPALDGDLKLRLQEVSWDIGIHSGILISMIIVTRDEIENTPLRSSQLVLNVREEGVKV